MLRDVRHKSARESNGLGPLSVRTAVRCAVSYILDAYN